MKLLYFSLILIGLNNNCQAQDYTIQHFQSDYDTLVDYHSVSVELIAAGEWPFSWEKTFNFGFEFPFYGDTFSELILDSWAVGYFPGSLDEYNVYLFGAYYTIADVLDTSYLNSEVRYQNIVTNDVDALVIEYHNVYESSEYDDYGANHFINFQLWFYENGVIEIHFGPIDLANCTRYLPGQGFTHDPEDPESGIYGPWVRINNNDRSKSAYFFGDHSNPDILYDDYLNAGVLTSIPPTGFIVQFLPAGISAVEDIKHEQSNNFYVTQHDGTFEITDKLGCFKACELYDIVGRKIGESKEVEFNISSTLPQILFIYIESDCGMEVHKVWVNQK